jgi:endoribonuclease LACTB2
MNPLRLHAANPGPMTGDGNWTYVIAGHEPVLIDAGVAQPLHLDAIAAALPDGPARVIVTHGHSDHVAGAPAIHERWPSAAFWKYPWVGRDPRIPWSRLDDGDIVVTAAGPLTVLHTPGHAPDHLTLWHPDSRTLFVGDMLVLGSSVVIPATGGGSLSAYLASLHRMRELEPLRALPAHGPIIEDPLRVIDQYLAHRAQRERQVLEALASHDETVDAITARIYPTLIEALVPMARESVLAHLRKLQDDHRVGEDDGRWRMTTA